ncbi:hypothetical protein NEISICOT_03186 [Neisseria sicca ATCC 29256]|uniref:Uncharacterized protein n=1 Tax=Neisseria sicca ATCC 29256 TaxID=547045 RepID=C6M9G7_NEISI|nr:hypothetical protein NEISICOT_03186 [Neisseria sicca ATCC 29256]
MIDAIFCNICIETLRFGQYLTIQKGRLKKSKFIFQTTLSHKRKYL